MVFVFGVESAARVPKGMCTIAAAPRSTDAVVSFKNRVKATDENCDDTSFLPVLATCRNSPVMSLRSARVLFAIFPSRSNCCSGAFSGSGSSKDTSEVLACSNKSSFSVSCTLSQQLSSEMVLKMPAEMSLVLCAFSVGALRILLLPMPSVIHQAFVGLPCTCNAPPTSAFRRFNPLMSRCCLTQVRRRAITSSIGMCEL
mmetsp:Transcript_90162/g.188521  ORF Transcript_90162/g.188521 Transcript_90162/m.188521 type:complete len:200 (+) Transcript_90162:171-770(+)